MTDPVFLFDPDTDDVPVNGDGLNAGWTITLPASVKRHALGAMRLAEGDGLSLTDGRGLCVKTTLVDAQAGLVSVERVGRQPQPVTRLVLIQALAKTGHDEAAIDMATQIGVDEVIPWQANRSIAKWKAASVWLWNSWTSGSCHLHSCSISFLIPYRHPCKLHYTMSYSYIQFY